MSALNTSRNNIDLRSKIVIGYYILVAFLGIWTITRPGSDIMTIYVFLKGEGNPQLNAFIQSTVYNLIFESLALWGSIVIIFLILTDKKYNKLILRT